jgi:dTDP-4-dehydrorhamnose reductase
VPRRSHAFDHHGLDHIVLIAVTGLKGQLVSSLLERAPALGHQIVPIGRPALDLARLDSVLPAIAAARPDLVVSAAAYTAVDQAEQEPSIALRINADGAGAVAEAAARMGVPLVHVSTDYVFDGSKPSPYVETDAANPQTVYGASKLEGERRVMAATEDCVILRIGWLYSPFGRNFVKTMLHLGETRDQLRVVADQRGGPTSALDVADAILRIGPRMRTDPSRALRGVFHLSPQGEATWADLAERVFSAAGSPCRVERIATADYPTLARRPANSRLNSDKLKEAYGVSMPLWVESLDACVRQRLQRPARG